MKTIKTLGAIFTTIVGIKYSIVIALILCSCGNVEVQHLVCGEVIYIDKFQHEYDIKSSGTVLLDDIPGAVDFSVCDSIAIFKCPELSSFLKVYSFPDFKYLGELLTRGIGPGEFAHIPTNIVLRHDSTGYLLEFTSVSQRKFFRLDVLQSLKSGKDVYRSVIDMPALSDVKYARSLASEDTLLISYDFRNGFYCRTVLHKGVKLGLPSMCTLQARWSDIDINMLSFVPLEDTSACIVAEAMTHLNEIVYYSPSDTLKRKTLCVGTGQLPKVRNEDKLSTSERKRTYCATQLWRGHYLFLYNGISEYAYQKNEGASELQFFNSDGLAMLRVKLPIIASSFYLTNCGELYLFNMLGEVEKVYRCDIAEFAGELF